MEWEVGAQLPDESVRKSPRRGVSHLRAARCCLSAPVLLSREAAKFTAFS